MSPSHNASFGEPEALPADHPARFVNLARYPVHDLAAPEAARLVEHCRRELRERGACVLHDFLSPMGLERMVRESGEIAHLAHYGGVSQGTAYLEAPDETKPENHPRRRLMSSSVRAIAYDLIRPEHALRQLYEWDGLLEFIAAVVNRGPIYRYADPLGALNIAVMKEGDHLLWHFDQTDFVTSILLQDCESGGCFEYVPFIRSKDDENYDRVERLLDGDQSEVIRLEQRPGTFAFFEGRYSIHRVTDVVGPKDRYIALLGFDTKPGTMSSDRLKMRRYGRLA